MKQYYKFIICGFINACFINFIGDFIVSIYYKQFENVLWLVLILNFLSTILFIFSIISVNKVKKVIVGWVVYFLCFIVFAVLLLFIINIVFKFVFLPVRETSNADGLLIIISQGLYVFINIIIQAISVIVKIIYIQRREHR